MAACVLVLMQIPLPNSNHDQHDSREFVTKKKTSVERSRLAWQSFHAFVQVILLVLCSLLCLHALSAADITADAAADGLTDVAEVSATAADDQVNGGGSQASSSSNQTANTSITSEALSSSSSDLSHEATGHGHVAPVGTIAGGKVAAGGVAAGGHESHATGSAGFKGGKSGASGFKSGGAAGAAGFSSGAGASGAGGQSWCPCASLCVSPP